MKFPVSNRAPFLSLRQLAQHVDQELDAIRNYFSAWDSLKLDNVYAIPDKPRAGLVVYAATRTSDFAQGEGYYAYFNGDWNYCHPGQYIVPASITPTGGVGGAVTGTVSDVQTYGDGNVLVLAEAATTPGFEMNFNFTNVEAITGVVTNISYDGSAAHEVGVFIYNYTTTTYDALEHIATAVGGGTVYRTRTVLLPRDTNYIDGGNNAVIRLSHVSAGDAAHNCRVDYVGLLGTFLT